MRYRDSLTGHYVSKGTYNRSHAQGGERYVAEPETERAPEGSPEYEELDDFLDEWEDFPDEEVTGSADYAKKSGD